MGTYCFIKIKTENPKAQAVLDKAQALVQLLHDKFNPYDKTSELSQLNRLGFILPEGFKASSELFEIIKEALHYAELTQGNFDPTIGALTLKTTTSTTKKLSQLVSVSYKYIKLNNRKKLIKFEKKGLKIDLCGIAKGYAIDEIAELLEKSKIKEYFINFGGNIRTKGRSFIIGIEDQFGNILSMVSLKDSAISTSGNFPKKHIISPFTGEFANECILATVISRKACACDALSTGLFVAGKNGLSFIEKLKDTEALILTKQAFILKTKGFNEHIKDFTVISPKEYKISLKKKYKIQAKEQIEMGEYEKAIESLKKAIKLAPQDAELYYNLGVLYDELGENEKAVEAYIKALTIQQPEKYGKTIRD
jgi:thiamine biosynthesis lipoprotein